MIGRVRHWSLVLLVWVVAATTWSRVASAQTLAMAQTNPVIRTNDDTGRDVSSSTDPTLALTITGQDCRSSKLKFKFSLTVAGYDTTQTLQAWVTRSTDCSSEYTSATSVTRTCWRVDSDIEVENGVATVEISAAKLLGIGADEGFKGNQAVLDNSCDNTPNSSGKGRQSFNVYFLLTNSENKVAANTTQRLYYSLVGPDAPAVNRVAAADQALQLTWSPLTSSTTELTYEFYCATNEDTENCKSSVLEALGSPGPASTSNGGAGGSSSTGTMTGESANTSIAGTAGLSTGGGAGDSGSAEFGGSGEVAGTTGTGTNQPKSSDRLCGRVSGKLNGSGYTNGSLANGRSYAVALGVRDAYGNLGQLSAYLCAEPRPIETFFEAYRDQGGKAGGGFCNLGLHSSHTTLPLAAGLLGLSAWLRRKNRKIRHHCPRVKH